MLQTEGRTVMGLKLRALVVSAIALGVAAPAAVADGPHSMDEAIQQGDPAATAPSVDIGGGNEAVFEGERTSVDSAVRRGGACLVDERPEAHCYRTEARLQQGEHIRGTRLGAPQAAPKKGRVRAAACSPTSLRSWENASYGGWVLYWERRQYWGNLTGQYNDAVSSFDMGNHSGHLSEHSNGGGYWYPGDTSVCGFASNMGSSWNDRVSSEYRN
jgi:hypothetical protein